MKLYRIEDGYNYYMVANSPEEAIQLYSDNVGFTFKGDEEEAVIEEMLDTLAISVYLEDEEDTLTKTPSEWVEYFGVPGLAFTEGL